VAGIRGDRRLELGDRLVDLALRLEREALLVQRVRAFLGKRNLCNRYGSQLF
jgi:hypothetical protein